MKPVIFFVSSLGDTDLAKATIHTMLENKMENPIFIVPVTKVAKDRINDLTESPFVTRLSLADMTEQADILEKKQITAPLLEKINMFITKHKIHHAYVGVPSPLDEEIPYQIALALKISYTIAYEYMFTAPATHKFWEYKDRLACQKNGDFAVPLEKAKNDIEGKEISTKIQTIGHLSIDRALTDVKIDAKSIKTALAIKEQEEFVFISGTTQPTDVDKGFLNALLKEIATGKYPHMQLRFGIHPGVKNVDDYLKELLAVCNEYPAIHKQFKILLPTAIKNRCTQPVNSEFILHSEVSGADAAEAANRVAQAVPGALLNEAALKGKPVYFHVPSSKPYLPTNYFATDIATLFSAKQQPARAREELGLKDSAPSNMANILKNH